MIVDMPREAKVGGGVWHEYILLLKKKKKNVREFPLGHCVAPECLKMAWAGVPGAGSMPSVRRWEGGYNTLSPSSSDSESDYRLTGRLHHDSDRMIVTLWHSTTGSDAVK